MEREPLNARRSEPLAPMLLPIKSQNPGRVNPWQASVIAVVSTAATLVLRLAINDQMDGQPALVMFTLPIMLSAYVGGLWAGLLATGLSYLAASYYLLPPLHSFQVASGGARWLQFFLALTGGLISVFNEALHRARHRADLATHEHQEAEEEAAQLVAIVESSDSAIIGKDLQGTVTSWNAGAERLFGWSASEMIGHPIARLIPHEREEEEARVLERIGMGEHVRHFKTIRTCKSGVAVDVSVTVSAIRSPSGKIVGISKVARDITEDRENEKALSDSELRYRRLFESAQDGILILDASTGRVVDVNPFLINLLGFSHDEFLSKAIWELGSFKDVVANEENFAELRAKEYLRYDNLPLEARGGRRIEVEFVSNVYLVSGNKVIQCNVRDVTARRAAEESVRQLHTELEERVIQRTAELEAANKELEAFSYSVSHDLRSPLRAVDGFSQAVIEDYGAQLPEEGRRYLQTIREGAQKMGILIDDLLTFSRLSRAPLHKQPVNTRKLVEGVLDDLGAQREGRQVDLRIGELPASVGDPALLKQVWINLLSNAFKYTRLRETAMIEIGCSQQEGQNVWFVRDNGAGFDMRYAPKLFGVFQRLHRVEDYEGTGVGLAIVQRVINRHGGRIWAEAAVDVGATFFFTLEGGTKL
jgi:PAS domain S-box-containing protein